MTLVFNQFPSSWQFDWEESYQCDVWCLQFIVDRLAIWWTLPFWEKCEASRHWTFEHKQWRWNFSRIFAKLIIFWQLSTTLFLGYFRIASIVFWFKHIMYWFLNKYTLILRDLSSFLMMKLMCTKFANKLSWLATLQFYRKEVCLIISAFHNNSFEITFQTSYSNSFSSSGKLSLKHNTILLTIGFNGHFRTRTNNWKAHNTRSPSSNFNSVYNL